MPSLIITIVLLVVSIVFAVQNAGSVSVQFLVWNFNWPLALFLILFFAVGLVIGLISIVPSVLKKSKRLSQERKKVNELERQKSDLEKEKNEINNNTLPTDQHT